MEMPSGKLTLLWKIAIYSWFTFANGWFSLIFHTYVSLPEGISTPRAALTAWPCSWSRRHEPFPRIRPPEFPNTNSQQGPVLPALCLHRPSLTYTFGRPLVVHMCSVLQRGSRDTKHCQAQLLASVWVVVESLHTDCCWQPATPKKQND